MDTTGLDRKKIGFGSILWIGLAAYVLSTDSYALASGKETLSEAFGRAMMHPKRRWFVIVSWLLTTKHLFFRRFIPWLDPFGLIAVGVAGANKIRKR